MRISKELSNAFKEVNEILENMENVYIQKIPKNLLKFIQDNMNYEYQVQIDNYANFEEQQLLKETKLILGYIFLNFWATPIQKKVIEKKFEYDKRKDFS